MRSWVVGVPWQARGAQLLGDQRAGGFGGDEQPQATRIRRRRDCHSLPRELLEGLRESARRTTASAGGVTVPVEQLREP